MDIHQGHHQVLIRPAMATIRALRLPVDECEPCEVIQVQDGGTQLGRTIGAGFLEDAHQDLADGEPYCLYLDEDRDSLRGNNRAAVLAARLGWIDLARQIRLSGNAVVTGVTAEGLDTDVPAAVLVAAWRGGLLPAG